ncbi:hypothetical protein BDV3_002945 [Batrachochytrium dendrobatidis]|uniref:Cyclin domain-containing protein, variant 2 n=1 Tax=Batrachochytrium dendrobatidis (strain JEL423) TaxID=403673 RepID=A0A177WZ41_BATDL|nr:cyclin domain-containing protein, variant 2 [Batrachochytrium dendrobatidis JEL423]
MESAGLSLLNTQPTLAQLDSSPSRIDDLERCLRIAGTQLINSASILLQLPQVASSTAQVLFQRFFFCASLKDHSVLKVASACLFLSTKLEECPRMNRDLINVFHYIAESHQKRISKPLDIYGTRYNKIKNDMIDGEMRLLVALGFNVQVQHPHGFLVNYLQSLDLARIDGFVQKAWNYLNDSGQTIAVVLFQPSTIAVAAILYAAENLNVTLPQSTAWWQIFDASLSDAKVVIGLLQKLYETTLPKSLNIEDATLLPK